MIKTYKGIVPPHFKAYEKFANTPKGATGSAVMFNLIQTVIENGREPYRYLTWLPHKVNTNAASENNSQRRRFLCGARFDAYV